MIANANEETDQHDLDKIVTVSKMSLTFNDKECQVFNIKDITIMKRLKLEKEKSRLLNTLCTSVHHEVLGPLKVNAECSLRILRLTDDPHLTKIAKTIHFSSKLLILHSNDLIDQQIMNNDGFRPVFAHDDICKSVLEITDMVRWSLGKKNIRIVCNLKGIQEHTNLAFDKRRLQQVLLNLLSNAVKFQQQGIITVSVRLSKHTIDGNAMLEVAVKDKGIGMT